MIEAQIDHGVDKRICESASQLRISIWDDVFIMERNQMNFSWTILRWANLSFSNWKAAPTDKARRWCILGTALAVFDNH